jgi:putative DNA primase/helicase
MSRQKTFAIARGAASNLAHIVQKDEFSLGQLAELFTQAQQIPVQVTFEQYQADRAAKDDPEARSRLKSVKVTPWFAPGVYEGGKRDRKSLRQVTGFVGDADQPGTTREKLIERLDSLGCSYVVHTSTSHGCGGQERYRVIIPFATPIDPQAYPAVWHHFSSMLESMLDPGAKDPTRLSYMPRVPLGAVGHTVICVDERPWFDAATVPTTSAQAKENSGGLHMDASGNIPLSEEQVADIRSALAHPRMREQMAGEGFWSEMLLALLVHGEQGFELAQKASRAADNYQPGCVEDFFARHQSSEKRSDYRHILKVAADLGWQNPIHARRALAVSFGSASEAETLQCTGKGRPLSNVHNAALLIEAQTDFKVYFDEFLGKILIEWTGEKHHELTDADITRVQILLQQRGLKSVTSTSTHDALNHVAVKHQVDCVRDFLEGLQWDGTRRLTNLMRHGFGVEPSRYSIRAGRNMLLSLVARALNPGCQVDEALVFEGPQGGYKSSALRILGGEWFAELLADPRSKDFELQLRGVWLGEFAELSTLGRGDVSKIKQFITNRSDRLRAPYGRTTNDYPRRTVLCGTTNDSEWLMDATGGRRFIPIEVGRIDLEWLRQNRDQLFAEAVALYQAGRKWWVYPKEATLQIQQERQPDDPWESKIRSYIQGRRQIVDIGSLLEFGLAVPASAQTKATQTRVGMTLRKLGCKRLPRQRLDGKRCRPWIVPAELAELPRINLGPISFETNDPEFDLLGELPAAIPAANVIQLHGEKINVH